MCSGAEGHARVDLDGNTGSLRRLQPGRDDDQPLPDRNGLVVFLPGLHPVLIGYRREGGSRQWPDHAQVKETFFQFLPGLFQFVIRRQERSHRDGSGRCSFVFIAKEAHALLGGHAVGRKARQYIRHSLGQFAIDSQGNFEPAHIIISIPHTRSSGLSRTPFTASVLSDFFRIARAFSTVFCSSLRKGGSAARSKYWIWDTSSFGINVPLTPLHK